MSRGRLILFPNLLFSKKDSVSLENIDERDFFPKIVEKKICLIDSFIAESRKNAIRYLRYFFEREKIDSLDIKILNEHTKDYEFFLKDLLNGKIVGLISDSGMPCIADPGSRLVALCNKNNILTEAISGPCSILLALVLSGFYAQKFCFHGYLPIDLYKLKKKIKEIEKKSFKEGVQIFIETPYRSLKLLDVLLKILQKDSFLCVAKDLDMPSQRVVSKKIIFWKNFLKKDKIFLRDLKKRNAVFLISK